MTDFDKWLRYYEDKNGPVDREAAQAAYDEAYFCTCESCIRRKELGYMPVPGLSPLCQLPANVEIEVPA